MPHILVRPDELTALAGALTQTGAQLRALSARLGAALGRIDWSVQERAGVEAEVAAACRQAGLLAAQAEQMAQFLAVRAEAFRSADTQGLRDLESRVTDFMHTVSDWAGHLLHDAGSEVAALVRVGSVAAGPVTALTTPFLDSGRWMRQTFPGLFGLSAAAPGIGAVAVPRVGVRVQEPVPPGPTETRLPTADEVRYIQRVLGVTEDGYGPQTKAAVASLQRANGIEVDPETKIGPRTWAALRAGTVPEGASTSAAELAEKFDALGWGPMKPWAGLIWQVSQETGLAPEMLAAKIMAESSGVADASAGAVAGKGLMQIEFSAHWDELPGETDAEKRAWILVPENNVRFGAKILKGTLDQWIAKYGPDEGLKRGLQYWNYGPGAAAWVEEHSKGPDDWQYWVQKYHDTHWYDKEHDRWLVVESGGNYGTPLHWKSVHDQYEALMGRHPEQSHAPAVSSEPVSPPAPVSEHVAADLTETNAGIPVAAPLTNQPGNRSEQTYRGIIDQFAVAANPRYEIRDSNGDGDPDTFCNIYVWDVTKAMGAEIPHWVHADGSPAVPDPDALELTANGTVKWLENHGTQYGWREVSGEAAQALANDGHPAVAAWGNPSGIGHVAVVRPGTYDAEKGATISQAGGRNFDIGKVADGFGENRLPDVRYYTHD